MTFQPVYIWKQAPFLRYMPPFVAGIVMQWMEPLSLNIIACVLIILLLIVVAFNFTTVHFRYIYSSMAGISIYALFFFLACILVYLKDARQHKDWIHNHIENANGLIVNIKEPLSEKPKSYRAFAELCEVIRGDTIQAAVGTVILYLKKDSRALNVTYGSRVLINASKLQPIKNFANANGFDYKKYCALQNIYHQAYLEADDYRLLAEENTDIFYSFLFNLRDNIITILKTYIKGKQEAGLAEALLIGYKDDLDKSLLQSYSNTGVVHVIAISGLHVGLIYSLLLLIITPLTKNRHAIWIRPVLLLIGLWTFSLLAGGSPSVLRSAVMFSSIVIGNMLSRNNSIFNSLAASAFLLLCYNPLWLWDVGFQLSYIAVASLAIFARPIYNLLYVQNKILDLLWKMVSVTLAAQILTTPICLYYFHQFPNMFLITNVVVIPLSSIILVAEIILCCISPFATLAEWIGSIVRWLIKCMNDFILYMERVPFAVTNGIDISLYQVIILYIIIVLVAKILLEKEEFA